MDQSAMQGSSRGAGRPVLGVIPARYGSTRFPGKLLVPFHGRTILEHVHRRALRIRGLDRLLVATDDERIASEVRRFGGEVMMTVPAHASGTDRIGEVLARIGAAPTLVLNLQGDEPLFSPKAVDDLLAAAQGDREAIWTLAAPISDEEEYRRPSVVKVVRAEDARALYFYRAPVPFFGDGSIPQGGSERPLRHVGVYAYPRPLLERFLAFGRGRLERAEGLEQLRALEAGIPIRVLLGGWPDAAIDTPEDLERLKARYPHPEDLELGERDEQEV
jgi:3-deoxy-manno-octulosonate cytidylyltransferase (CMP-KDO synthetase)